MERSSYVVSAPQDEEQDIINPKKELRCSLLKTTLKSFVVTHVSKYYQACGIRVMLPHLSKVEVWLARQKLEERLASEPHVVGFFSCGTALYDVKKNNNDDEQQAIAGVTFWIMFDWPDMAIEVYESHITRVAMDVGLDTVHCKAVKGRGVRSLTDGYVSSLYITLKNQNNETLVHHYAKSQVRCLRAAAEQEGIPIENVEMTEGDRYSSKILTSLWLCKSMDTNVAKELRNAVECVKGMVAVKLVDLTSADQPVMAAPRPVTRLMQCITMVKAFMNQFDYALFDGFVYKKVPEARYPFVFCSSVHNFIHFVLGNSEMADQIVQHVTQIINLLSESACRIIKPLQIDYNFIEVTPYGTCFNIREKCFQLEPADLKGSPRAFVKYLYNPDRTPHPEPFIKGVENSFGNPRIRKRFYKKYYQLLMHGQFPHKETKLCLVGPPDSGKTSWFTPFQGIIPARYIAGVMNDGRFSAAMIESNTQIVMMDEWTPDSLSCEDAKRVLQGGMNFVPQKHKNGLRINYNSGFFITTNEYPDFGNQTDCDAIRKRLEVFQTSSLKRRDTSVSDEANNDDNTALVQALDHAIIQADRNEGILYEDLQWETELFDNVSEVCDTDYIEKVITLAANVHDVWDSLQLTENAKNMFRRRLRINWEGPDTVYDAWLVRKGYERSWFDYPLLYSKYPDFDPEAEQEPPTQKPLTQQEARASSASEESFSEITSYQPPRPELVPEDKTPTRTPPSSPKLVIPESPVIPKPSTDSESSINNDVFDEPPAVTSSVPNKATKLVIAFTKCPHIKIMSSTYKTLMH
ncbi:uncharacterized protein [Clytia hemisphaerica]|uniref:uncharacterized protein n=1 Tax=Clytia hemisphaerica TaxID=252671 RepID=UPI0034D509E0